MAEPRMAESSRPMVGLTRAQSWEDPAVLVALGVTAEDEALTLDPSGDDGLALAIAGAGRVEVAVPTPAARALVELKLAAVRELPIQSVRSLFGLGHFGRRVWFYHYLRPCLSSEARTVWDAHEAVVRSGLSAAGTVEREMEGLRRALPLAVGSSAVRGLLDAPDEPARRAILAEGWGLRWRIAVRRWAPRIARAARGGVAGAPDADVAALEGALVAGGPFVRWLLEGTFGEDVPHPWLTPAGHAALRARLDAVEVTLADPAARLRTAARARWSIVALGRWNPGPAWPTVLRAIRAGGRALVWSATVPDVPGEHATPIADSRGLFPERPWIL